MGEPFQGVSKLKREKSVRRTCCVSRDKSWRPCLVHYIEHCYFCEHLSFEGLLYPMCTSQWLYGVSLHFILTVHWTYTYPRKKKKMQLSQVISQKTFLELKQDTEMRKCSETKWPHGSEKRVQNKLPCITQQLLAVLENYNSSVRDKVKEVIKQLPWWWPLTGHV